MSHTTRFHDAPFLLVGGNGFIGRHLALELSAHGANVRIFDRPGSQPPEGCDFVPGEIESTGDLRRALDGCHTLIYLVHQTGSSPYLDPDRLAIPRNLDLFLITLEAALASGVKKLVFFSSGGAVYGPPEILPVPETHPLRPISAYGICKSAMESYQTMFALRHGLSSLILRPSNPYGPGQNPNRQQGVIAVFWRKMQNQEPLEIWGDGSATKDYLHVSDLAHSTRLLLERGCEGTFNIGSGVGISLLEVVSALECLCGKKADLRFLPPRPNDVQRFILDITKLRQATGFTPSPHLELEFLLRQ